jgi:hypothetical protein
MSFDINKEPNPQQTPNIILYSHIKEIRDIIQNNREYIKYSFYGDQREPIVKINKTQYISKNLYIWKGKIHNIPKIHYDGELIIETTNGNQKTFLCFLLKHSYSITTPTIIDKLWKNKSSPTPEPIMFDLDIIDTNNSTEKSAIYYKDGIDSVIVLLEPILISTNLKTYFPYPKCFIIPNFANDYTIVKYNYRNKSSSSNNDVKTIQEHFDHLMQTQVNNSSLSKFIEGFTVVDPTLIATDLTENGLYLDCAPTSQSTNTLPAITIPLDKNGNVNLSNSLLFTSIMNSLILFIIIVFIFLSLPTFYKFAIVDVIANINVPDKATRLTTVSIFSFICILTLTVSLVFDGLNHSNIYESYAGLIVGLMLFIGTIRLYFLRNNQDYSFQKVYNWNPIDIFIWLKEVYNYLLDHSSTIGMVYIFSNIVIILAFIIPAFVDTKNFIPSHDNLTRVISVILGYSFSYNIIISAFSYLIYDTYRVKT